jgi:MarR family transcriptional regulator, organic hydroperoxide resistance regulator
MQQVPAVILISSFRRQLKQAVIKHVRPHGLSPQQFWILNAIYEHEGTAMYELAARVGMDAPTTSRVVTALVASKLVRTDEDPSDRRRARLWLTTKGRALALKLHEFARKVQGAAEAGFTASERQTLRVLLGKAIRNLNKLEQRPRSA